MLSGDKTSSKENLMERIIIYYFRRGEALKKESVNGADPIPCVQPSSFNINVKSLFAEL